MLIWTKHQVAAAPIVSPVQIVEQAPVLPCVQQQREHDGEVHDSPSVKCSTRVCDARLMRTT